LALKDGNYGQAYRLLYRFAILVLNHIPKHPEYKNNAQNRKEVAVVSKRVARVLEDLGVLKPMINNAYEEWSRMRPADETQKLVSSTPSTYKDFAARDPALTGNVKILDATKHQDLAVDLAKYELTRRDTARRASRQPTTASDAEAYPGARRWPAPAAPAPDADLRTQMEAVRRNLGLQADSQAAAAAPQDDQVLSQHYNYPSISRSRPVDYERSTSQTSIPSLPLQPSRPPKEPLRTIEPLPTLRDQKQPPAIPRKEALDNKYEPLIPGPPALPPKTSLEQPISSETERLTFQPGGYLENGDPIRSVFIPKGLREGFLEIAADNTRRKLEMCGILLGTVVNNALFIRCLLIPEQICTSDTCETINEDKVFDYSMKEELIQIGWIHTHPVQTCFMSSRDLHTQSGYQIMMAESIAIVCAPKFEPRYVFFFFLRSAVLRFVAGRLTFLSYGIFRLTNPPGLDHIINCQRLEPFHPHEISNLDTRADGPGGHVIENDKLEFYVHDLREK
jgi:STAM-binding protein